MEGNNLWVRHTSSTAANSPVSQESKWEVAGTRGCILHHTFPSKYIRSLAQLTFSKTGL